MINDIAHARSFARDLKRQLKPLGTGHLAAHDIAARTLGQRDWRTLSMSATVSAERQDVEKRLRQELGKIDGADSDAIVSALLPPAVPAHRQVEDGTPERRRPHADSRKVQERPIDLLYAFDGKQLDNLYHAMKMDHSAYDISWTKRMEECVQQGYFPRAAAMDMLEDWDNRLHMSKIGMHVDQLIDRLGYSWTNMTSRPLARATSAMMFKAMPATTFTGLVIILERLGFVVPAEALVKRHLAAIKKTKALSPDELAIFWYARERDRFHMRFLADDVDDASKYVEGKMASGYRYEITGTDDRVRSLDIYGRRYRRRPGDWH